MRGRKSIYRQTKSGTYMQEKVALENLTMPALFLSYIFWYQSKIFAFNKHIISIEMRDGSEGWLLIRFCRDYMPYLFIGVIGLDRYRRFRYLPPADPIASLTRFSRFLSNNVPCARKAKGQLFSPSQLHTFRHLSTDHYTIS